MTSNVAIKVTADVSDLTSRFAVARAETNALSAELNKLARATVAGTIDAGGSARMQQLAGDMLHARAATGEFASQLNVAGVSVGGFANRVKPETQGVASAFQSMSATVNTALQFTGIGLAIAGIRKLFDVISETAQRANEIRSMSEVLGVTGTQFQAMQVAAEEAGIGSEQLFRAEEKLVNTLNEARDHSGAAIEKLKELGITNDQIRDTSFGAAQMIAFLSGRLSDGTTKASEMAAMLHVLGPRAAIAAEGIKALGSNTAEWNALAVKANALSDEQTGRLHEIGAQFGIMAKWIQNASSKVLIWAADHASAVTKATAAMGPLMATTHAMFEVMAAPAPTAPSAGGGDAAAQAQRNTSAQVQAQAAGQAQLLAGAKSGNAAITKETLDGIRDQIEATKQGSAERLALMRTFYQDSLAFYAGDATVDTVKEAHRQLVAEERDYGEAQKREAEKAGAERIAATRAQIAELGADERLGALERLGAARDLWQALPAGDLKTAAQRIEVQTELNRSLSALTREAATESQTIARQDVTADQAISRLKIEAAKSAIDLSAAADQATIAAKLAALKTLTTQEEALNEAALTSEMEALKAQPAAYNAVYNQIRELKAKLVTDLAALDKQAADANKKGAKEEAAQWHGAVTEIEAAESGMVSDLLTKRKSLSQSLLQVGSQLVTQEIANDLRAMTTRIFLQQEGTAEEDALKQGGLLYHAGVELQKTLATQQSQNAQTGAIVTGEQARLAATSSAAATSKGISAAEGGATVMADAAAAYSGTYASVSHIPVIGWILAPAAAAAAFAAVAAYEGLASLDVGAWNVPGPMVAQLHKGEAVMPASFAEGMRQSVATAGAGGGGGGGDMHAHFHLSAFDSSGLSNLVHSQGFRDEIAKSMSKYFARGGRG